MAAVVIKLNKAGMRELLRSQAVQQDMERRARLIAAAAGDGMAVESEIGPNRARAEVRTDTFEARHAEATTRNLSTAVDAGR